MMKFKNIALPLLTVALAAVMGSCNLYKTYQTPTGGIIGEYAEALKQPVDSSALGNLRWQEVFTDPLLRSYIDSALVNNTDLQNAKLNIDIAQARLEGAKLSYLPSLSFGPNGSGSKVGSSDFNWSWQAPLTLSWQADIFGQITNTKRQAQSAVLQSEAYRQAVQSQIIAAVASCYYTLVSLNNQLAIYNQNAALWKETVGLMQDMKTAGRYTEVAVVQSKANYYNVLAAIPDIKLSITETNNTLSLLLNTKPQQWQVNGSSILTLPGRINDGVPMTYLAARPDVRAAEQTFAQAYYATNIARANFYPQLILSAKGGYGTLTGLGIVDPAKWFATLAGSCTAPIFSRGQNTATLKAAKLQQQQALNNFQYSVLNAASEVSNALVNISATKEKQMNVEQAEQNLEKAVQYNKDLMNLSTTTYIEVISAQQSLLSSQIQLENVKLKNNTGIINLYQALGGGR
jgi:outer membrane protein, multidrug efflux system